MLVRMLIQLITIPLFFINCKSEKEWPLTDPDPPTYTATGITLQQNQTALAPGWTFKANATVTPKYASDSAINWKSNNTAVATVDNEGLVTAVSPGIANIIATTKDDDFADTLVVKVIKRYSGEPETLVGYAAYNGTTTGGEGGPTVTVTTLDELKAAALSSGPRIILVSGTITGPNETRVFVSSNKTILGQSRAKLVNVGISIYNASNVIVRNLQIEYCRTISNLIIKDGAHHVWVDHCSFRNEINKGDGYYDGMLDIGASSERITNYVTVSWCKFTDADQSSLIGSYQRTNDAGSNLTTFHHNLYQRIIERGPKAYQTTTHVFNNYYFTNAAHGGYQGTAIAPTYGSIIFVENCYFEDFLGTPLMTNYNQQGGETPGQIAGEETNIFKNCGPNSITTPVPTWRPPYDYAAALTAVEDVPALVLINAGTY